MKILYTIVGTTSLILGIIGIFLPLLPTTPFLLLTAAMYFRSSPRWYHWLIQQKYLGSYIRNNREFDAISKEIEYQELQIQLNDKHIKEYTAEIKVKKKQTEDAAAVLEERKIDLEAKRSELESIDMETADEMARLREEETRARAKIDERLLSAYSRIRSNVRNGLAVVTVKRDACGGCFNRIPPQRQFEIRQNKKIIVCEYCGRILVSDELDHEEEA